VRFVKTKLHRKWYFVCRLCIARLTWPCKAQATVNWQIHGNTVYKFGSKIMPARNTVHRELSYRSCSYGYHIIFCLLHNHHHVGLIVVVRRNHTWKVTAAEKLQQLLSNYVEFSFIVIIVYWYAFTVKWSKVKEVCNLDTDVFAVYHVAATFC